MLQRLLLGMLLLLACAELPGTPQRVADTNLVVRVGPEASIDPSKVPLHFQVSADGTSDVRTQAAVVTARVRALPGQKIRVMARLTNLYGPVGPVPAAALRWTASVASATAGATQATCSGGAFTSATAQDVVQGWGRSGTLSCAMNFELTGAGTLAPGAYSGLVDFTVGAQ
jgi:hypothetical protein